MKNSTSKVVVAQMKPRERAEPIPIRRIKRYNKRLLRKGTILAAVVLCLGMGVLLSVREGGISAVMSHVTAGFEYDETLGRLQFVSHILPESAMVFLTNTDVDSTLILPTASEIAHTWSAQEPWLEYACSGEMKCCKDGEVLTIIKNRSDEYTVRVLHRDGYESVYSGLTSVSAQEGSAVSAGQCIGSASGFAAFELRRDGLSVLPVFSER